MTLTRYRKRPDSVEAVQWDGTAEGASQILEWVDNRRAGYVAFDSPNRANGGHVYIPGAGDVLPGDWVIRETDGRLARCHMDFFAATYEPEETPDA